MDEGRARAGKPKPPQPRALCLPSMDVDRGLAAEVGRARAKGHSAGPRWVGGWRVVGEKMTRGSAACFENGMSAPLDPIGNPETVVYPCENGDCGR